MLKEVVLLFRKMGGMVVFKQRKAVDVALHLLKGGAYLQRINQLKLQGVKLAQSLSGYYPS
jgi:trans-AT polyketide synthase/acyltransferase/oxidoreductase domain-containing protein